jgi:hypothetical protein
MMIGKLKKNSSLLQFSPFSIANTLCARARLLLSFFENQIVRKKMRKKIFDFVTKKSFEIVKKCAEMLMSESIAVRKIFDEFVFV